MSIDGLQPVTPGSTSILATFSSWGSRLIGPLGNGMSGLAGRVYGIAALLIGGAAIYGLYRSFAASITESDQDFNLKKIALGADLWKKYYGHVGVQPELPLNIHEILNAPCRIWRGKKVHETHMLVLIPATIDDQTFNRGKLGEIIQNPKKGDRKTRYHSSCRVTDVKVIGPQSYWFLMTKDILPDSLDKDYPTHLQQVADLAEKTKIPYAIPTTMEAATGVN